jgi:ElaB/YqjD/DUF883 family membrane-anchored ribosome-binding protein
MAKAGTSREYQSSASESNLQGRFSKQIDQARERVNDSLSEARERLGDFQATASDFWDDTIDYVRENPGKVIAFSLGLGIALGLVLRFRNTEYIEE